MAPHNESPQLAVLLVEDEVELSHALRDHLLHSGFRVQTAGNGAEALRRVMEEDFDAVVCDMVMPQMPGDMFYRAVGRIRPPLCDRFLFITGHGETPSVREFLAAVSGRVIHKPFHLDDLLDALRQLLREEGGPGAESDRGARAASEPDQPKRPVP